MTKVEELRRKLDTAIDASSKTGTYGDELNALHCVEPLISAAIAYGHAEGVAEGAEQERAEIRSRAQVAEYDADGYAINFVLPAFVLSPKEEK